MNFINVFEGAAITIALPAMQAQLNVPASELQWVVLAYLIGFGPILVLCGRLADAFGGKLILISALTIAIASAVVAITALGTLLILARFMRGVAAALCTTGANQAITSAYVEAQERSKILGYFSASGAAGFCSGLLCGALASVDWRIVVAIPAALAAVTLFAVWRYLPAKATKCTRISELDLAGAALATIGVGSILVTLQMAMGKASAHPYRLAFAAIAACTVLCLFVQRERRAAHPMVPLALVKSRSALTLFLTIATYGGTCKIYPYIMSLYLQSGSGWSPLSAGLLLAIGSMAVAFCSPAAGRFAARHGGERTALVGAVLSLAGFVGIARTIAEPQLNVIHLIASIALAGVGVSFAGLGLSIQTSLKASNAQQGLAAGLLGMSQEVGGAIFLSFAATLLTSPSGAPGETSRLASTAPAATLLVVLSIATAILGSICWRMQRRRQRRITTGAPVDNHDGRKKRHNGIELVTIIRPDLAGCHGSAPQTVGHGTDQHASMPTSRPTPSTSYDVLPLFRTGRVSTGNVDRTERCGVRRHRPSGRHRPCGSPRRDRTHVPNLRPGRDVTKQPRRRSGPPVSRHRAPKFRFESASRSLIDRKS